MSTTPAPRRAGLRERKPAPAPSPDDAPPKGKRKRAAADSDSDEDDDPKPKRKAKQSPSAKKPRKTRKTKEAAEDAFDPQQAAKESKINADNPIFNAILNPAAALQSIAEAFLESLDDSPNLALAELINCVLRACGCNESLNSDQAVDYDGVVDVLDDFTEGLKKEQNPTTYPLTSKLPVFKKFRKSLHEFLERLITAAASLGTLYTSELIPTIQAWVIAMSSSQIRSFRHTATFVALEVESALCDVAAAVEKEAEMTARQREGEKRRAKNNKSAGDDSNKNLEAKATEIRGRRDKLKEFIKDFIDGLFVHRYRDLDPTIRADCTLALGTWFTKHPAHFLDATYLRYIGWVLSDGAAAVRLAALKALTGVYSQRTYAPQVHHFTERFKGRLLEMAACDVDATVRVAVIGVLEHLGATTLEEDEREKVALCVFDADPRIRKAIGPFVRTCWQELVEERLVGHTKKVVKEDKERAGVKALGGVLVRWGARLDAMDEADADDEEATEDGEPRTNKRKAAEDGIVGVVEKERNSRAGMVVEALWDEVEAVSDWETLLEVLILDHSSAASAEDGPARRGRPNGKAAKASEEGSVDEAWRLEEEEETVLIEVLVASLKHAQAIAKKGEDETMTNDITRELIKGLPRLLVKYQTDQNRIANILSIPPLMNLDLYLEMRMITNYNGLWDDIIKQFLSHSSPTVLGVAVLALKHLMAATSLSNANSGKIHELEDELASALRDSVAGRDEIEVAGFDEDEILALGALCTRLRLLAGCRDMTEWMDDDEGGKQTSAWDIVSALVERGRLGYKEEAYMITQALNLLTTHLMWKRKRMQSIEENAEPSSEEQRFLEKCTQQRDSLLEKLVEYAVGTQSNTAEAVTRTAFMCLMDLHTLFGSAELILDDEVQFRCAGYVQAEIERYAETLVEPDQPDQEEEEDADDEEKENDDGEEENDEAKKKKGKSKAKKGKARVVKEVDPNSASQLLSEYSFIELTSTFLRSIYVRILHVRHAAILLSHYGRLGSTFDHFAKTIMEMLREEGMVNDNGDVVVVVINQALQEAFTMVLDGIVADETNVVQLAKQLAPAFLRRGAHLAVLNKLDVQYIVQIQTASLSWIAKRIGGYESTGNKKALRIAVTFFKALIPLLSGIQARDAMKIKAHMDQVLAQAKVEVSATSKAWEPQRAYEKRLSTIMAKDKVPGTKGRKAKVAKAEGAGETSSEDETDLSEVEKLMEERDTPAPEPAPRPRPRPKRLPKKAAAAAEKPADDPDPAPDPATPRPRTKTYQSKAASKSPTKARGNADVEDPLSPPARSQSPEDAVTTPVNKKRRRPEDEDEEEQVEGSVNGEDEIPASAREATPAGDMQIRKKRARH
ncbi:hypothetical protein FB45DRAFT_834497 [Roridomyces roridus]|uniref:SCD domain-containing protein n=1 Tax=Roridomyces roridus TaxID=1738132 RepID=A0AAD7BRA3_9AGAR|nr:hypothetical protein FB45DRAFT_834497 [Roridomyces roridus]